MAPIFVGTKAERAAFKNAGGFTSEMRKQKGKAYDMQSYAAERSKSNVSVIRSAASGTIKPDFKSRVGQVATSAALPLAVLGTAGQQPKVKSLTERIVSGIPDLPGTWDDKTKQWIIDNPKTAAGVALAAGVVGGGAYLAFRNKSKKKSTKKKSTKKKSTRKKSRSTSRRRKSAPPRRARRRGYGTEAQYKRKGGKDVKYTKNGQPYVIQSNGRARFIKRSR